MASTDEASTGHGAVALTAVVVGAALIAASSALENEGNLIPLGVGAAVIVALLAFAAAWNRLGLTFGLLLGCGLAALAIGVVLTMTGVGDGWLDCGIYCSATQNATGGAVVYGFFLALLVLIASPVIAAARAAGRR